MDELTEYLMNNAEDGFWSEIQSEARREAEREPALVSFLFASVLRHSKLEDALCVILANKLQTPELSAILICDLSNNALTEDDSIRASIRADLLAARTRDPAAHGYLLPFLYYKGFHALQALPLVALLFIWAGAEPTFARRWIHVAGLAWIAACLAVAAQMFAGHAPLAQSE